MDAIFEIMQQLGEFGDVGQMRGQRLPALTIGCKWGIRIAAWEITRHLTPTLSPVEAERESGRCVRVVFHTFPFKPKCFDRW